jgi:hypothetical protein
MESVGDHNARKPNPQDIALPNLPCGHRRSPYRFESSSLGRRVHEAPYCVYVPSIQSLLTRSYFGFFLYTTP